MIKKILRSLLLLILASPIIFIIYVIFNDSYLEYQAENLCDTITIGSTMEIDKLKDRSTIEFQNLKSLAENYGSNSYGIYGNYVLINFNFLIYMGYRCVIKTQDNIVSDKKICYFEDDKQCFDLNL